jgi:hypothetical protein
MLRIRVSFAFEPHGSGCHAFQEKPLEQLGAAGQPTADSDVVLEKLDSRRSILLLSHFGHCT